MCASESVRECGVKSYYHCGDAERKGASCQVRQQKARVNARRARVMRGVKARDGAKNVRSV
jgi:hypothetical protein